jgi:drug/metabolite transporter (DMT)-like permease
VRTAALLFGERLILGRFAGLLLGLMGVGLTLMADAGVLGSQEGAVVALAAAAGLAVANLVTKDISSRVDALTATGWPYLFGVLPLLAWSLAVEDPGRVVWSWRLLAGLIFLGLAVRRLARRGVEPWRERSSEGGLVARR